MRVAYVSADPGVPVFGRKGCSIHVQEVIRALRGHGGLVDLFASRPGGSPPPDLETVRLHTLPFSSKSDPAAREQEALAANSNLRAALERFGSFDLVYERYSLWSFAGMEYARTVGVPGVLEVNAPLIEEQAIYRDLVDRANAERVAEQVFGEAGVLIAVSDGIAEYLKRYPNTAGRVHVVTNGVNPDRFCEDVKPSRPGGPDTFTVGFVGTLKAWHGLPDLSEGFAMLYGRDPNSRLLIVGDGPERPSLIENLSARGLLGSVCLTGAVHPDQIPGLMASMDVAVAPYPMQENFYFSPLKVYEYMVAGLPVVASRIGQLTKLIQDGKNGLLYPPGDCEAMAMMLYKFSRDPELRARLGRAARATVLRDYTWRAIVQRILRLAETRPSSQLLIE